MILIVGSLTVRAEAMDEALELPLEHVRRSRAEPGCISPAVYRDVEDPNTLVFIERWADADAVRTHFAVPASGAFVASVSALLTTPPALDIYEAVPADLRG